MPLPEILPPMPAEAQVEIQSAPIQKAPVPVAVVIWPLTARADMGEVEPMPTQPVVGLMYRTEVAVKILLAEAKRICPALIDWIPVPPLFTDKEVVAERTLLEDQ